MTTLRVLFSIVLAALSAGIPTAAAASALAPRMEAALRETGMVGAVWATVEADGTVRTGAAGLRDTASGRPMAANDKVHVGSVTKTLIATGVLQLASAGRVDLDAPVARYLPDLALRNPWPDTPVRVRHLLDHTAGLDDMRLWQLFSTRPTPDTPLHEAFRDPSVLALRSRPGSQFSYSNMGYTLAAMVIEAVTGERYETWLDRELLRPLGMHDSTLGFTTQVGAQADPRLAWGHLDAVTPAPALPVYLRPAGQFTTTAADLARFARFLMGDGRSDGRLLVAPALLRAMGRVVTTDAARAGLQAGYALGLARRDRHGVVGLCHAGSVVGFHAMLCLFPSAAGPDAAGAGGSAFVVVQNTDSDGVDTGRFDALLIDALAIPSPAAPPAAVAPHDIAAWEGCYTPAPNRFHAFRYADFLSDRPCLRWDGVGLQLSPLQGASRVLRPAGGTRFVANDRRTDSHVLLVNAEGQRLISDGQRTYRRLPAGVHALAMGSLALGLAGLLWVLLVVPVRGLLRREPIAVPGVFAAWLLLLPVPAFLTQSFVQLGDRTLAAVLLYAATGMLPGFMAWQAARSARRREGLARGRANLLAALLVLQWCAVLFSWDMLPFAIWR